RGSNGEVRPQFALSEREKALTARANVEAERSKFKLAIEKGEFLPAHDVCFQVETAHSAVRRELSKKLLHEIPARLEGLNAPEMKLPLSNVIDALSDALWNQFTALAVGAGGGGVQ